MLTKIIIAWILLDVLVYFYMWMDHIYYKYNLPLLFKRLLDTFTEED